MKRLLTLAVIGTVVTACVACQPGATGLSDQDKAAIRKVVEDTTKLVSAPKPDYAVYTKLYYAEDATVLASNIPPIHGRAAIQAVMESFPPMSEFKADIVDLDGRGDLAYVRGNYIMTLAPPGGPAVTDKGKYIEVWKKGADGTWKVSYDSWTSDLPVPGLLVPTGAPAEGASAEAKMLGDIVGRWQIDGTVQPDPKTPAGPVALSLDCRWFAGGTAVVCSYGGVSGGQPYQEFDVYSYDARTKSYSNYAVVNFSGPTLGKVTIQPGTWVHLFETQAAGKPAKQRLTLTNVSPDGGDWKNEMSVAGGAWTAFGGGKYVKAK
jgi:ketosteroid isomerase-like protein